MKLILIGLIAIIAGTAVGVTAGYASFESGKAVGLKQAAQACIAERGFTYSKQRYSCNLVYVSAFGGEQ